MAKKKKQVEVVPTADKEWQAESDADCLIRSQEILADPKRKKAATMKVNDKATASQKAAKMASDTYSKYVKKA